MSDEPRHPHTESIRILVVEDDPATMQFLEALIRDRGYEVLRARNGVEAMVALTAPHPELPHAILLDIGLPLEGGASVLHLLRNVLQSRIPVIVITGRQDAEEEATLRELGITAFLRKPPNTDQILSALSEALH